MRRSRMRISRRFTRMNAEKDLLALGVFGRSAGLGERVARLLECGREFSARVSGARLAASAAAMVVCTLAGGLAPRVIALAQEAHFEVTSVRRSASADRRWAYAFPPGGYKATNVTLHQLILSSYRVFDFQLEGSSGWIDSDRFDVEGKAAGNPDRQQILAMARQLLADRFKFKLHHETKQLPTYELAVAKGGIKLKEGKCVGEPSFQNPCGGTSLAARGEMRGREETMAGLAAALSGYLGRVVVDKTGLSGTYDWDLHWTPDETMPHGPGDAGDPPPDSSGPSLFTAVQEQLGLELKSSRGPVDVLVIDHAEKPDEN